jgi:hypothetical protein
VIQGKVEDIRPGNICLQKGFDDLLQKSGLPGASAADKDFYLFTREVRRNLFEIGITTYARRNFLPFPPGIQSIIHRVHGGIHTSNRNFSQIVSIAIETI